jgi:hypothetical protein
MKGVKNVFRVPLPVQQERQGHSLYQQTQEPGMLLGSKAIL